MLTANSIPLAIFTMIMSIPLFLSYNIKHLVFPKGLLFAWLFFWGLASVSLVPILLILEIVVLSNLLASTEASDWSRQLTYTVLAIFVSIASIGVFLFVRIST